MVIHLRPRNETDAWRTHEIRLLRRIRFPGANLEFVPFRRFEVNRDEIQRAMAVRSGNGQPRILQSYSIVIQRGCAGAKAPMRRNVIIAWHWVERRTEILRTLEAGLPDAERSRCRAGFIAAPALGIQ